ncbi:hypothetical protein CPS_1921 [Colwellia psychrerythraea 34H]|uniref:Uncharacterized protein n=1 Tax=Colwellia psychrerythraea (strain 34H / ATCC BAA-681) TaxID=167879 RepID=Q483W5_COLP3|nr:hypothetical protein CPS_1921 [Colwellia psychrerythraea 34H]
MNGMKPIVYYWLHFFRLLISRAHLFKEVSYFKLAK